MSTKVIDTDLKLRTLARITSELIMYLVKSCSIFTLGISVCEGWKLDLLIEIINSEALLDDNEVGHRYVNFRFQDKFENFKLWLLLNKTIRSDCQIISAEESFESQHCFLFSHTHNVSEILSLTWTTLCENDHTTMIGAALTWSVQIFHDF